MSRPLLGWLYDIMAKQETLPSESEIPFDFFATWSSDAQRIDVLAGTMETVWVNMQLEYDEPPSDTHKSTWGLDPFIRHSLVKFPERASFISPLNIVNLLKTYIWTGMLNPIF